MFRSFTTLICLTLVVLTNAQWLDPNFGNGGSVTTTFIAGRGCLVYGTLVQPDGKIVITGNLEVPGGYDFLVARYLPDGTLDMDFGTGGFSTHPVRAQDFGRDVALQADGGIVVVGSAFYGPATSVISQKIVLRFTANGNLDPTFGNNGTLIIGGGSLSDALLGVAIQPDQRIVVAGRGRVGTIQAFYIARLNNDGSFDQTFGNGGGNEHLIGAGHCWAEDLTLMDDGRIVAGGIAYLAGSNAEAVALVRYLPNGTLDNSFGDNGVVVTPWSSQSAYGNAVAVQADGRVILAGSGSFNPTYITASRFLVDGTLDPDFGVNGTVRTIAGAGQTGCGSIAIDANDRILLAGTVTQSNTERRSYLCRLSPDGTLDPSFGDQGEVIHGSLVGYENTPAMTVQSDGKILLAGFTKEPASGSDYNALLIRYTDAVITSVNDQEQSLEILHADVTGVDLRLPTTGSSTYWITSSNGKLVQEGRLSTTSVVRSRIVFDRSAMPGLYAVTLITNEARLSARFVVME